MLTISISWQLNNIKIVKRHVMSISSKYIHISIFIYICCVSISRSRFLASNNSEFRILATPNHRLFHNSIIVSMLSLLHRMIVLIKALVSIFNNERVVHRNWCRWTQSLLFLFLTRFILVLICLRGYFLGWHICMAILFTWTLVCLSCSLVWWTTIIVWYVLIRSIEIICLVKSWMISILAISIGFNNSECARSIVILK